jgi:hypothetical protein
MSEALPNASTEAPEKHTFEVVISYDGVKKHFEAHPHELVKTLLDKAIRAFGITQNQQTLALFTEGNVELPNTETLKAAGVKAHTHLLLRPSTVRGG